MKFKSPVSMERPVTIGDLTATVAQLIVLGGAGGTPMINLQRSGTSFSWALAGGALSFADDNAGFVVLNLTGASGLNQMYIGQYYRASPSSRPSLLAAESFGTAAGADVPSNALRLQGGIGTGVGTPGDIEFWTGVAAAAGANQQTAARRALIKALTGQLQLPGLGAAAGILLGGDANLYRDAADVLRTDDKFVCAGFQLPAGAQSGYILKSDASGNGAWQAEALDYFEQPADPAPVGNGSIWVDTDATLAPTNQQLVPVGTVLTTAIPVSGTPPAGFLFCDGAAISRSTYSALFTAIGTAYGVGDGSTTFNLPNLSGRVPLGVGNSGEAGSTTHTLGQKGGEEKHTLLDSEMPSHTHDLISTNVPGLTAASWGIINVTHGSGAFNNAFPYQLGGNFVNRSSTGSAGSDASHNNLPPFLGLNHMIKT